MITLFLAVCTLALAIIAYHIICELYETIGAEGILFISLVAAVLAVIAWRAF